MIDRTPPPDIDTIELVSHRRHVHLAILTSVAPSALMLGLSLFTEAAFFLVVILLFVSVGALNYHLTESRPVPRKLRMSPDGIWEEARQGLVRQHGWSDVHTVREHLHTVKGRHRTELHFIDAREPLTLYPYAMQLTACNGQPHLARFSDHLAVTGIRWDRPITYARHIVAQHVPTFRA
jgi:hypothetical protein